MKNVVIIMAGGVGSRFWPISTPEMPKQFLKLIDKDKTMIQLTVERIMPIVKCEDIFIVTNEKYKDIIFSQLTNIPNENILFEPIAKNTSTCIAYATAVIKAKYGDANVIVLSSDAAIVNKELFIDNINVALQCSLNNNIVTLGIIPTRIETGYGYIKLGNKLENSSVYKVDKFVEKPSYDVAKEYYKSQLYLWNSGIFVFKNSVMEESFEKYMPNLYVDIDRICKAFEKENYKDVVYDVFNNADSISIDYGIMEKAKNICVVPCSFGWDDVGSWLSVDRLRKKDINENIIDGNVIELNCKNNILINNEQAKKVVCYGLTDIIVVNTNDSILIIPKDETCNIKKIIEKVNKNN